MLAIIHASPFGMDRGDFEAGIASGFKGKDSL
jgi:hypothetical protein